MPSLSPTDAGEVATKVCEVLRCKKKGPQVTSCTWNGQGTIRVWHKKLKWGRPEGVWGRGGEELVWRDGGPFCPIPQDAFSYEGKQGLTGRPQGTDGPGVLSRWVLGEFCQVCE
jgi:hypothetical protein